MSGQPSDETIRYVLDYCLHVPDRLQQWAPRVRSHATEAMREGSRYLWLFEDTGTLGHGQSWPCSDRPTTVWHVGMLVQAAQVAMGGQDDA